MILVTFFCCFAFEDSINKQNLDAEQDNLSKASEGAQFIVHVESDGDKTPPPVKRKLNYFGAPLSPKSSSKREAEIFTPVKRKISFLAKRGKNPSDGEVKEAYGDVLESYFSHHLDIKDHKVHVNIHALYPNEVIYSPKKKRNLSNQERMDLGQAPRSPVSQKKLNLHHVYQKPGELIAIRYTTHKSCENETLHFRGQAKSLVDRSSFDVVRKEVWKRISNLSAEKLEVEGQQQTPYKVPHQRKARRRLQFATPERKGQAQ